MVSDPELLTTEHPPPRADADYPRATNIKLTQRTLGDDRVVSVVVVSCGIISVCIGVTTFKCLFSGIDYTFFTCETTPYENAFYLYFRVSVALDIITDAMSKLTKKPTKPLAWPRGPGKCFHFHPQHARQAQNLPSLLAWHPGAHVH